MSEPTRPTGSGGPPVGRPDVAEVEAAARRLRGVAVRTPLLPLHGLADGAPVFLKPESLQPTGAFKLRGVYNWASCLTDEQRRRGLVTHSSGNTALALGHVARLFGVPARSVMPDWAPASKVRAVREAGVEPAPVPIDELLAYVFRERWRDEPYSYLNPWADPKMLAGSGTIGLEILDDLPDVDTVFVPVGGGGLVLGAGSVIKARRPSARVVGVQPEACPALHAAFAAGRPVWVDARPTLCDGSALPLTVDESYPLLREIVDEVVLVGEDDVRATVRRLALGNKLVVEGAGALSVAAALAMPPERRGRSVCVLSGGTIGADQLASILAG